ncbi:MAG: outer membrane protein assembly factor BamA [Calditrichaeota bacterium]|nr:outer membrane protein assembly factor BamA [Calditrichota bacterium]MCB0269734.1 outer membrane protein assembly factor BamA [Calditrichota bacterium]MCB9070475.1 outer membrane protein assembly factor BamA [Calditrichia bacterium]
MNFRERWKHFLIIFACVAVAGISTAHAQQTQQFRINTIKIEGNETADSTLILLNSGLIRSSYVSGDNIQRAIRNLWQLNIFSNVQVLAERQSGNNIDLIIRVEEYPRLEGWTVVGNDKLKKKEIDKEIGFYRGMVFTPFAVYKAQRDLVKKYKDEGYLLATVSIDTSFSENDRVIANLNVKEGKKVQIKRIQVLGAEELDPKDLRKSFKEIKEKRWWRGADFDREKYETDQQNLLAFCRKNGFRDAEIVRDSIYYSEDKRDLFIDVYIEEGRRYYFGDVSFEGNTVFTEPILRTQLLFEKGDIYNQEDFEKSIRENIQNLYYNQGYLFANILPLEVPVSEDTVDIKIRINEGNVVRIKEIIVKGNTKTNEKVVRREFKIFPGDVFNRSKLERSVRDVWVLNYFANVVPDVKLLPDDEEHVNLEVTIEERSTDTANMSAGYSQRDGFIGSVGFSLNNFSLKRPLTGGDGQRLTFQWDFGRYYRNLSLSFIEPWTFGSTTLTGFSIFSTRYNGSFRPWDGEERGGSVQLGRRFRWPDNYFRGDWILRIAENRILEVRNEELLNRFLFARENSMQISLTQVIRRDSRNRPEFPTAGSVFNLRTKLAGGPLQGDEDFIKNDFTLEWYVPMKYGLVFFLENRMASIAGLTKGYYINPNELFFMGGSGLGFSESLRGYDDGRVGPTSGGTAMARFTAEVRFPIAPNPTIFGLMFMEAGNVWDNFSEADFSTLKRSIGFGARLFMPLLGIIGVDFGYGYDYYDNLGNRKGDWKVHFKFGQF